MLPSEGLPPATVEKLTENYKNTGETWGRGHFIGRKFSRDYIQHLEGICFSCKTQFAKKGTHITVARELKKAHDAECEENPANKTLCGCGRQWAMKGRELCRPCLDRRTVEETRKRLAG